MEPMNYDEILEVETEAEEPLGDEYVFAEWGIIQGGPKKWIFVIFWDPKIYFSKGNFMFLGVILCGESIVRIPESWKCFPGPDSGKNWVFEIAKNDEFRFKNPIFPWIRVREAFSGFGNARNRFPA